MAKKNGVSVTLRPVVCIEIVGRGRKASKGAQGPMTREDDNLVGEFLTWQIENGIFGVVRAGYSGGGGYLGFFAPEDLERIKGFFLKKGFKIK